MEFAAGMMQDMAGDVGASGRGPRVLCIRHGQSLYNAAYALDRSVDPLLYDSVLSPLGHEQVALARLALREEPVELVIVSPLSRAIQTAIGIFSDHPGSPRIVVDARHRERLDNSCDRGRPRAELAADFPSLHLDHLPEVWWHDDGEPDHRGLCVEPQHVMDARAKEFLADLARLPERVVAVVGHGAFFLHVLGLHMANCEVVEWQDGEVIAPEAGRAR